MSHNSFSLSNKDSYSGSVHNHSASSAQLGVSKPGGPFQNASFEKPGANHRTSFGEPGPNRHTSFEVQQPSGNSTGAVVQGGGARFTAADPYTLKQRTTSYGYSSMFQSEFMQEGQTKTFDAFNSGGANTMEGQLAAPELLHKSPSVHSMQYKLNQANQLG